MDDGHAHEVSVALARVLGEDRCEITYANYNVGLQYLAAMAERAGASVTILDPMDPLRARSTSLLTEKFTIIGFTVHHLNMEATLDVIRTLRKGSPASYIILGGHHASGAAAEILADIPAVNAVCVGEGEEVIHRVVSGFRTVGAKAHEMFRGILRPHKYVDFTTLPAMLPPSGHLIGRISTSRGCPFDCAFCTTPGIRSITKEPTLRCREPSHIVDELCHMHAAGIKEVRFNDDIFVLPSEASKERARDIARLIIHRGLHITYKVEYRVDSFREKDKGTLLTLRDSGLREVFLGIESGSDRILSEYNKRTTFASNVNAIKLHDVCRVVVNAGNILASPDSEIEDICDSISGFESLGVAYLLFRRSNFRAHVFPGTALEASLREAGRLVGGKRYLPLDYRFRDERIDKVCALFEETMPWFLRDVGGRFFAARKNALTAMYDAHGDGKEIRAILEKVNRESGRLLRAWFHDRVGWELTEANVRYDMQRLAAEFEKSAELLEKITEREKVPS